MDALKELKYLLLILLALFLIWMGSGGPARYLQSKPFITPATPYTGSEQYGPR